MSDLISRSALINALKVHFDSCFREDGELLYSDHICTSDDVADLIKLVENQPTACDFDKVVGELKEKENEAVLKAPNTSDITNQEYQKWMMKSYGFKEAIEIVKQGGVSDDVCECRLLKGYNFLYKTSCGYVFGIGNDLKFCPYCGKKIKVVE